MTWGFLKHGALKQPRGPSGFLISSFGIVCQEDCESPVRVGLGLGVRSESMFWAWFLLGGGFGFRMQGAQCPALVKNGFRARLSSSVSILTLLRTFHYNKEP